MIGPRLLKKVYLGFLNSEEDIRLTRIKTCKISYFLRKWKKMKMEVTSEQLTTILGQSTD